MLNRLVAWFDTRYSPVALAADPQPPMGLWKFTYYFLRQFKVAFLFRIVLVAIGSVAVFVRVKGDKLRAGFQPGSNGRLVQEV
jgi:hypothetical protein